jgi:tRNA nucleotidyltransferase (CCA-adding enzyme)
MQAIDAAAHISQKDEETKLTLIYAAMCHDLGKSVTTEFIDGRWCSRNHAQAGVPIAKMLLARMMRNHDRVHRICLLVRHHMAPGEFVQLKASAAAYKRLANKLSSTISLRLLADLSQADKSGRNPKGPFPLSAPLAFIKEFTEKAQKYGVLDTREEPLVSGKDLLSYVEPGPKLGALVKKAYQIQIEKGVRDKQEIIKRVLS